MKNLGKAGANAPAFFILPKDYAAMQHRHNGSNLLAIEVIAGANILGLQARMTRCRNPKPEVIEMSLNSTNLLNEVRKFAAYRRTKRALGATPMNTRFDLDLYDGDFDRIAHKAVYGY